MRSAELRRQWAWIRRNPRTSRRSSALRILHSAFLILPGGLSRLLFVRDTPANWDSVQFALSLDHFDLHSHQPHPPGYILYVLAGQLLRPLLDNPNLALSLLSVLSSAIAAPLLYWLALAIFDDNAIALGSVALLIASPLALYYGSVGLTYAPEMAFSIAVALLAWKARESKEALVLPALLGVTLGLAGGVRQSSLLVLLPLGLWALWGSRVQRWLAFAVSVAITCALWVMPLLVMSGGLAAYLRDNANLAEDVSQRTSLIGAGVQGALYNISFEALALGAGLAFAVIALGLWALRLVRFEIVPKVKVFLLWWVVPPMLFFAVSHVGQYGYLLVVLPAFLLISALCLRVASVVFARQFKANIQYATMCVVIGVASFGYFSLAQGPVTAAAINQNDEHWKAIQATLAGMDAGETALLMGIGWDGPFRTAGYLLPQFHSYALEDREGRGQGWVYSAYGGRSTYALPEPQPLSYLELPTGTRTLIALDDKAAQMMSHETGLSRVALPDGSSLYVLHSGQTSIQGLAIGDGMLKATYNTTPTSQEALGAER